MITKLKVLTQPAIIYSAIVTALLLGIQQLGATEGAQLKAFDQMMQRRTAPDPNPRILVVAVTENLQANCRLVAVLGIGGIGKTTFSVRCAQQIKALKFQQRLQGKT